MKNLEEALERTKKQKQVIINNKSAYYYTVDCHYRDQEEKSWFSGGWVDVKRTITKVPRIPNKPTISIIENLKRSIDHNVALGMVTFGLSVWGSVILPSSDNKSGHYTETLFDQERYDGDLRIADQKIQQAQNEIQIKAEQEAAARRQVQREAEKREAERRAVEKREAEKREAERRAVEKREAEKREAERRAVEKRETEKREAERRAVEKQEAEKREAERRAVEKQEAEKREAERREVEKRETEKREAERREAERQEAEAREKKLQDDNKAKVDNMSVQERTCTLANSFEIDDTASRALVDHIKSAGFDANYLGYLAIKQDNQQMLALAIAHQADCSEYIHDGKTLLQLAIELNAETSLQRILSLSPDFSTTFINTVNQQNLPVIDRLLILKPDILQQEIHGLNLLRIAVTIAKPEVLQRLLAFDSSAIQILNDKKGVLLKLAIENNPAVINSLLPYINLKQEFANLIKAGELELCKKVAKEGYLDVKAITELLEVAIVHEATDIIQQLANSNSAAALEELWISAIARGDEGAIVQLAQLNSSIEESVQQQEQVAMLPSLNGSFETNLQGAIDYKKLEPDDA